MNALTLNGFNGSPYIGQPENLSQWIDAAAAAGFAYYTPDCPAISAWLEAGRNLPALAQQFREAGIGCAVISVAAMLDGSAQQDRDLAFSKAAGEALGAQFLQVNVGAPDKPSQLAALERACDTLTRTGLKLALEYMPISPLATLADTVELVDAVGHDKAGALVDIWHHNHDPQGWETLSTVPLSAIAYAEFDDALPPLGSDLIEEMLHRRTMPGEGVLDCARFAHILRDRGYDGLVSVEIINREWRERPITDFTRACHDTTRAYFP